MSMGGSKNFSFTLNFADITISGHAVGDNIPNETKGMERITKSGGTTILCHDTHDAENDS